MTDLPGTVGYLTVKGRISVAFADSNDVGTQPDMVPTIGTVTFAPIPGGDGTIVLLNDDPEIEETIIPRTIVCDLDALGNIRAPADGISTPASGDGTGVRLMATDQATAIQPSGWAYLMTVTPAAGQPWRAFSRTVSGAPDETKYVSRLILEQPPAGLLQGRVYILDDLNPPYPDSMIVGVDWVYLPSTKELYSTEED